TATDSALRSAKWESVAQMAEAQAQLRESPIAREKAAQLAALARQKSAEFGVKTNQDIWDAKLRGYATSTQMKIAELNAQVEREKIGAGREARAFEQEKSIRELAVRDPREGAKNQEKIVAMAYAPEDAKGVRRLLDVHNRLTTNIDKFLTMQK